MIASWGLLAYVKAADTRQNASFAVKRKTALASDAPDDPLQAMMGRKEKSSDGEPSEDTIVMKKASRFRRRTMDLESTIVRTRVQDPDSGPDELRLTTHDMPKIDRSSDDEIDAFFAKFDENPEEPVSGRGRNGRTTDDTDDFIRSLEEMAPVEDHNDWGQN